jgi:DNA-binding NarL/FixJ family response regulator
VTSSCGRLLVAPARLLLADDNAQLATEIRTLLEQSFEVVGVVNSSEELETAYERLTPEVVVTDIAISGTGGLGAFQHLRERYPGMRVVLLSPVESYPLIQLSLLLGVLGFVVQEDAAEELVPAVDAALQGRRYVSEAGRREPGTRGVGQLPRLMTRDSRLSF